MLNSYSVKGDTAVFISLLTLAVWILLLTWDSVCANRAIVFTGSTVYCCKLNFATTLLPLSNIRIHDTYVRQNLKHLIILSFINSKINRILRNIIPLIQNYFVIARKHEIILECSVIFNSHCLNRRIVPSEFNKINLRTSDYLLLHQLTSPAKHLAFLRKLKKQKTRTEQITV